MNKKELFNKVSEIFEKTENCNDILKDLNFLVLDNSSRTKYCYEDEEHSHDSVEEWLEDYLQYNGDYDIEQPEIYNFHRYILEPIYAVIWKECGQIQTQEFSKEKDARDFLKEIK